jgi:hypothetical protein
MRAIATSPNISPEAGRSRWEEQRQSPRDSSGSVIQLSPPSSAGVLTELGEFARASQDSRVMRSFSHSSSERHLSFTVPPPPYDEATDSLAPLHGQRSRLQFDEHIHPHHAAYDTPLHRQTSRPLPAIPRRYDGRTTPMESAYFDHNLFREGRSPMLHQQSMKKSAVTIAGASEYTKERPDSRLSTTRHTGKSPYRQDLSSSKPFHTSERHPESGERPHPHVLDNENDMTPPQSFGRSQERSVTQTVDPMRGRTSRTEPSTPNHTADTPPASRAPVVTTSVPSLTLPVTAIQAESDLIDGSQETQPKKLSKMERALLRRAVVGMKVDNPQLQRP